MKRFIKSAMLAAMACSVIAGGAACKPNNDENKGKTAIRLSYFIGEFGDEWLKSQAKEWSASNEKYYVDVKTNLNLGGTIVADIRSGWHTTYLLRKIARCSNYSLGITSKIFPTYFP